MEIKVEIARGNSKKIVEYASQEAFIKDCRQAIGDLKTIKSSTSVAEVTRIVHKLYEVFDISPAIPGYVSFLPRILDYYMETSKCCMGYESNGFKLYSDLVRHGLKIKMAYKSYLEINNLPKPETKKKKSKTYESKKKTIDKQAKNDSSIATSTTSTNTSSSDSSREEKQREKQKDTFSRA